MIQHNQNIGENANTNSMSSSSSSSFQTLSNSKTNETPPPYGGLCLDPPERIEFKQQNANKNYVKLIIKNPTQKRIAFSINATGSAPKRYRIRPTRSILYPGQSEKVEISLRSSINSKDIGSNSISSGSTNDDDAINTSTVKSSSSSTKFDFKNDRFEVKYFYFDEQENQHQTPSDTDTISIFVSFVYLFSSPHPPYLRIIELCFTLIC